MRGRLHPVHRETALVGKAMLKCGSAVWLVITRAPPFTADSERSWWAVWHPPSSIPRRAWPCSRRR